MAGILGLQVVTGTTLERLTIEQMAEKSTLIVRGRVSGCAGEQQGAMIYTRCQVAVSETWKGAAGAGANFLIPGGTLAGLAQTFVGAPAPAAGQEYVLFLWAGKSGRNQIIGLSQGLFDVTASPQGFRATRAAIRETMLDGAGKPATDNGISMPVDELRARVRQALGGDAK